jgi:hypothetical protein
MALHTVPLQRVAFRAAAPLALPAVVARLPRRLGLLAGGSMFALWQRSYPSVGDVSLHVPRHFAHVRNVGQPSSVRSFGIVPHPPHRPQASSPRYGSSRQPCRATTSGVRSLGALRVRVLGTYSLPDTQPCTARYAAHTENSQPAMNTAFSGRMA